MNGIEAVTFLVLETAGGIGISSVVTNAAIKAAPKSIKTAEKVCIGVGTGMACIAADQIISREVENWYMDTKKEIKKIFRGKKKHHYYKNNNHHSDNHKHN